MKRGVLKWRSRLSLAWILGLGLSSAACLVREPVHFEAPEPSFETQLSRRWHANGKRSLEAELRLWSDGRVERHGRSRAWYDSGQLSYERFYAHDQCIGLWRSWYPSGALQSEVELADGKTLAPMRFYYESGQPSALGEGLGGVRQGAWSYWHPNGQLAERGEYLDMRPVGKWERWDAAGMALESSE